MCSILYAGAGLCGDRASTAKSPEQPWPYLPHRRCDITNVKSTKTAWTCMALMYTSRSSKHVYLCITGVNLTHFTAHSEAYRTPYVLARAGRTTELAGTF